MSTEIEKRCEILSDLWLNSREEETFTDFVEYNDLALPLAFSIAYDIVRLTPKAEMLINEAFDLLLAVLEIEDEGFDNLNEMMGMTF